MKSSADSTSDGPSAAGSAPSCSFCTAKPGNLRTKTLSFRNQDTKENLSLRAWASGRPHVPSKRRVSHNRPAADEHMAGCVLFHLGIRFTFAESSPGSCCANKQSLTWGPLEPIINLKGGHACSLSRTSLSAHAMRKTGAPVGARLWSAAGAPWRCQRRRQSSPFAPPLTLHPPHCASAATSSAIVDSIDASSGAVTHGPEGRAHNNARGCPQHDLRLHSLCSGHMLTKTLSRAVPFCQIRQRASLHPRTTI